MIDPDARLQLINAIDAYMSEAITAFQFDERIDDIADLTEDQTVKVIIKELWCYYDDITDHKIVADKVQWDYFERLRLLLESEAELEITRKWRWRFRQLIAAVGVVVFVVLVFITGLGEHLYLVAAPFGLLAMAIWHPWSTIEPEKKIDPRLVPFESHSLLNHVRRQNQWFKKHRYPRHLAERTIRSKSSESILWLQWIATLLIFGPLVLVFQSFPQVEVSMRVITPSAAATL